MTCDMVIITRTLRQYSTERISQLRIVGMMSTGIGIWQVTVPSLFPLIVSPAALPKV